MWQEIERWTNNLRQHSLRYVQHRVVKIQQLITMKIKWNVFVKGLSQIYEYLTISLAVSQKNGMWVHMLTGNGKPILTTGLFCLSFI